MLTPVPVEKVRIVVLREDVPKVVSLLHELGAVQLEQAERGTFFREAIAPQYARHLSDQAFRFEGLAVALPPAPVRDKIQVGDVSEVLEQARSITIDDKVRQLKTQLEEIDVRLNRNKSYEEAVEKISGFESDLSLLMTSSLAVAFYSIPNESLDGFRKDIISLSRDSVVEIYDSRDDEVVALVAVPKGQQEAVRAVFEKYKAIKLELPTNLGRPDQARKKLREETESLLTDKAQVEKVLQKISEQYYPSVLAIREALAIELQRVEALDKLGESASTAVIEGWVPKPRTRELEDGVTRATSGRYIIEQAKTKEVPPTLLRNNPSIRYFEFLVRFFSLPQSEEVDPTPTFAFVFPLFFGLMLGDVGYGVIILLVAVWLVRISQGKTSARLLPRKIRSFGRSIMSKRTFGTVGRILIPCSIAAIIFGALFNEYFGFALPYRPLLDVTNQLTTLLVITIFIGIAHISLGYVYGIYNGLRLHHMKHVHSRLGWLGLLWSATISLVATFDLLLNLRFLPSPLSFAYGGLAAFFVFGAVIGISEGPRFVMELPTLIGHAVSYARILGILLASVLLASIVDRTLAQSIARGAIESIIIAAAAFVGVQLLNLLLGVFEPSIQGVRLHYVEFYSKFFEGNGQPFRPFSFSRNYTKGPESEQKPIKPPEATLKKQGVVFQNGR